MNSTPVPALFPQILPRVGTPEGMNGRILQIAEDFVRDLFRRGVPAWAVYHTLEHTEDVVLTSEQIGRGMGLRPHELEVVLLAAWFHDVGYIEGPEQHEQRSARAAAAFLRAHGYPEGRIQHVEACIRATELPHTPNGLLAAILCDADVMHIGRDDFRERSDMLRTEWERRSNHPLAEPEWLRRNEDFLATTPFLTPYARIRYDAERVSHLAEIRKRLRDLPR